MAGPPTGTVTFLFTDIAGSTRLWEDHPEAMRSVLARHDALVRTAIEDHGGHVFKTIGDAFCAAFALAPDALGAALTAQQALMREAWPPETGALRVRMALHIGGAQERDGDYFGPPLNRVARLLSAAHGGQVLLSLAAQELVRDDLPVGASLQDLGPHRLKDLTRAEQVFQLFAPGLPVDFPPLRTLDNRPNNLPRQPTPLLGREEELAQAGNRLGHEDVRLLTLTGPGGTGKTRLGLQVAAEALDDFPDGAFFIALASVSDPDLVVPAIAHTLGIPEAGGTSLEGLCHALRDKRMLLVLDNFEQVVSAAAQIADLLVTCPHVKAIATSRVALQIRGEQEFPVPPLPLPNRKPPPPLAVLSQFAAVQLFVQRAQSVKPDFAITADNAPTVAEICWRLDGLPLAIELAAARVKLLPPQAMLPRLEQRLKLLTGGARDLPARQQTLRSAIAWSHDLLDEDEKALFRRLAAFVGGCTLDTAEAVCVGPDGELDVLEGVGSLLGKSLLRQTEDGPEGMPRFLMLETIREFAGERLAESGEETDLRRRHAVFFAALIQKSLPERARPATSVRAEWLEPELGNLHAALAWALENDPPTAGPLGAALGRFCWDRGLYTEGRECLESVLAQGDVLDDVLRIHALLTLGSIHCGQADCAEGVSLAEQSLALSRQTGDREGIAQALLFLVAHALDPPDIKQVHLDEAQALCRALDDRNGLAWCLYQQGRLAWQDGDSAAAQAFLSESLSYYQATKNPWQMGWVFYELGIVDLQRNAPEEARSHFEQAVTLFREVKQPQGLVWSLKELSALAHARGDHEQGTAQGEEALAIARQTEAHHAVRVLLAAIGEQAAARGDVPLARARLGEAIMKIRDRGVPDWALEDLRGLLRSYALLAARQGDFERAARIRAWEQGQGTTPDTDEALDALRAELGEERWQTACAEGRAMSRPQVIQYALRDA